MKIRLDDNSIFQGAIQDQHGHQRRSMEKTGQSFTDLGNGEFYTIVLTYSCSLRQVCWVFNNLKKIENLKFEY